MKNLLLGSLVLLIFSSSVLILQVSCSKSVATPLDNVTPIEKIIFVKRNPTNSNEPTVWTANYDGSNLTQVPIVLPANVQVSFESYTTSVRLSPDATKIFFGGINTSTNKYGIYRCDIDGSNTIAITEGEVNEYIRLGGAY